MNFTKILAGWYNENKRDLPWRRTRDPYRIWVSEIILQQTRIGQGMDYYLRFIERFPVVSALAAADEEDVLKIWQGLGYYSRARNMHSAARKIMDEHHGKFPVRYDEIRKLNGIGDYTAAAIASISFGISAPVLDGNVFRFFSRFFGIGEPMGSGKGKEAVLQKAKQLINRENPGDFNQAIMEFGALMCKPVPLCSTCPLKNGCVAFQESRIDEFPVKPVKQEKRIRHFNYLLITTGNGKNRSIFLNKRTGKDIWENLFDFPLIETEKAISFKKLILQKEWTEFFPGKKVTLLKESKIFHHILTHQIIVAKFYHLEISSDSGLPFQMVTLKDLGKYPVPRLIEKFLQDELLTK